MSDSNIS